MIENFKELKQELKELAEIVNSFKSEAVQLKIVELVFKMRPSVQTEEEPEEEPLKNPIKKTNKKKNKKTGKKKAKRKVAGRPGPGAMIDELITAGFFNTPKTTKDIKDHCQSKKAFTYTTNELSPSLGRALRAEKLSRNENDEGQYEYTKT